MPTIYSLVANSSEQLLFDCFMFLWHVHWVSLRLLVHVIVLTMPAKFTLK